MLLLRPEHAINQANQLPLLERLADVLIHACFQAAFAVALYGIGRQGDDRNVPLERAVFLELANRAGGLESIQIGHVAIHQNQVEPAGFSGLDRGDPVAHAFTSRASLSQDLFGVHAIDGYPRPEECEPRPRGTDPEPQRPAASSRAVRCCPQRLGRNRR